MNLFTLIKETNDLLDDGDYQEAYDKLMECRELISKDNRAIQRWITGRICLCKDKIQDINNVRDDLRLEPLARELGYTIKNSHAHKWDANTFEKDNKCIWNAVVDDKLQWRCADLIDLYFRNHRTYENLEDALRKEQ